MLNRRAPRAAVRILITIALLLVVAPAVAQEDVDKLEALKAERERIQTAAAAQAIEVDASTADFDVVAKALDDLNALVDLQQAKLADAEQSVRSAEAQVVAAERREQEIAADIEALSSDVADLAVASFTGESGANGEDLTALLLSDDPSEAARRRSLVEFQTGSLADGIDRLRSLVAEAEVVSKRRRNAVDAAEASRAEAQIRGLELAEAEQAQLELVIAAETRLEARLAEAAFIAERDADAAAAINRQEEAIASRIREEAARRAAAQRGTDRPDVPLPDDIVTVQGIQIHKSVSDRLDQMLSAARADGIDLGGWGYRSNVRQIELRQQHCGTSDYQVWDMPASACSPPTARPGQSMHERGLAVDFTYSGGSMTSRSNPGFIWLAANAGSYGFVNLPSEPWHWSINGD